MRRTLAAIIALGMAASCGRAPEPASPEPGPVLYEGRSLKFPAATLISRSEEPDRQVIQLKPSEDFLIRLDGNRPPLDLVGSDNSATHVPVGRNYLLVCKNDEATRNWSYQCGSFLRFDDGAVVLFRERPAGPEAALRLIEEAEAFLNAAAAQENQ